MGQKKRIKDALKQLQGGDARTTTVELEYPKKIRTKSKPRVWYNKFVFALQKKLVPSHFKNWLLGTTGMNVGHDCCIPHDISFDPYFPELITLGPGTLVGGGSTLKAHTVKDNKLTLGKITFAERAMCGGMSLILPGAGIQKNSILNMHATLDKVMPEAELWAGEPAKCTMKFTPELVDKFFKKATTDPAEQKKYYKEAKAKIQAFIKDPKQSYLKIYYNGNRAGAGNDWFRARSTFRIFYNGIITEFTRLLPHCWFKTVLLKMMGAKIGKNCYIGKGVVFDHIYGDMVTLEDNVRVDDYAYFDGHEYTLTQTVFGRVLCKKGSWIKKHTLIRCGCIIGEGAIIEKKSLAGKEIPAGEVWGGVPAKLIRKVSDKDREAKKQF